MDWTKDGRAGRTLRGLGVLLLVAVVGFIFDRVLVREGVPRTDILIESNLLTGIVAAVFYAYLGKYEVERRKLVQQRLRTIADMNHHIRNALQIITYAASAQKREDSVELIRSSVERIEWALREVLPGHANAANPGLAVPAVTVEQQESTPAG
jgi:hypothetical protein